MRASNLYLVLLLTSVVMLAANLAWADTDVSISLGGNSGNVHYGYDADWWWGDGVIYGDWDYSRNGLYIGYRDDNWDARYRGTSHDPYGTHPNDRPGYRVFIPRGLEYPPQYYGDPGQSNNHTHYRPRNGVVIVQQYPYNHYHPYYDPYYSPYYPYSNVYSSRYPVVIDYSPREVRTGLHISTGNNGHRSLYTAPDAPEYGYYRPAADEGWDYQVDGQPVIVNDNRTYNYYGDSSEPNNPSAAAGRTAKTAGSNTVDNPEQRYEELPPAPTTNERALGARFFDELRLESSTETYRFALSGANLHAGPDVGPAVLISDEVDASFGAFAAYLPGEGFVLVFRSGDTLMAAYPTDTGEWWNVPLPVTVDFVGSTPNIGLVGNALWATVTGRDGGRYVLAFSDKLWTEIGSGRSAVAQ